MAENVNTLKTALEAIDAVLGRIGSKINSMDAGFASVGKRAETAAASIRAASQGTSPLHPQQDTVSDTAAVSSTLTAAQQGQLEKFNLLTVGLAKFGAGVAAVAGTVHAASTLLDYGRFGGMGPYTNDLSVLATFKAREEAWRSIPIAGGVIVELGDIMGVGQAKAAAALHDSVTDSNRPNISAMFASRQTALQTQQTRDMAQMQTSLMPVRDKNLASYFQDQLGATQKFNTFAANRRNQYEQEFTQDNGTQRSTQTLLWQTQETLRDRFKNVPDQNVKEMFKEYRDLKAEETRLQGIMRNGQMNRDVDIAAAKQQLDDTSKLISLKKEQYLYEKNITVAHAEDQVVIQRLTATEVSRYRLTAMSRRAEESRLAKAYSPSIAALSANGDFAGAAMMTREYAAQMNAAAQDQRIADMQYRAEVQNQNLAASAGERGMTMTYSHDAWKGLKTDIIGNTATFRSQINSALKSNRPEIAAALRRQMKTANENLIYNALLPKNYSQGSYTEAGGYMAAEGMTSWMPSIESQGAPELRSFAKKEEDGGLLGQAANKLVNAMTNLLGRSSVGGRP